jgi:hypothetical protein
MPDDAKRKAEKAANEKWRKEMEKNRKERAANDERMRKLRKKRKWF